VDHARTFSRSLALLAPLALGVACSSQPPVEQPPPPAPEPPVAPVPAASGGLTPISIGASNITPLHAALEEILERTDILAQHGLVGTFHDFERGKDQHNLCVQGVVDVTFVCEVAAIVHLGRLDGTALSGSPGSLGEMALVVSADSPVQRIEELRGGTVSVLGGASSQLAFETWAEAAGILPSVRMEMAGGHGDEAVAQLAAGRIDAAVLWDPWLRKAYAEHGFRPLVSAPFWSMVLLYDERLPQDVQDRYHAALTDALRWARDNPDQAVAYAAERGRFDPELVREVLMLNDYVAGRAEPSLAVSPELRQRLDDCAGFARREGMSPEGFDLASRVQPTYLPPGHPGAP
jgi:ABC-type nitrate/sulfonate/bicarbonate transport system substrate-binding protein